MTILGKDTWNDDICCLINKDIKSSIKLLKTTGGLCTYLLALQKLVRESTVDAMDLAGMLRRDSLIAVNDRLSWIAAYGSTTEDLDVVLEGSVVDKIRQARIWGLLADKSADGTTLGAGKVTAEKLLSELKKYTGDMQDNNVHHLNLAS